MGPGEGAGLAAADGPCLGHDRGGLGPGAGAGLGAGAGPGLGSAGGYSSSAGTRGGLEAVRGAGHGLGDGPCFDSGSRFGHGERLVCDGSLKSEGGHRVGHEVGAGSCFDAEDRLVHDDMLISSDPIFGCVAGVNQGGTVGRGRAASDRHHLLANPIHATPGTVAGSSVDAVAGADGHGNSSAPDIVTACVRETANSSPQRTTVAGPITIAADVIDGDVVSKQDAKQSSGDVAVGMADSDLSAAFPDSLDAEKMKDSEVSGDASALDDKHIATSGSADEHAVSASAEQMHDDSESLEHASADDRLAVPIDLSAKTGSVSCDAFEGSNDGVKALALSEGTMAAEQVSCRDRRAVAQPLSVSNHSALLLNEDRDIPVGSAASKQHVVLSAVDRNSRHPRRRAYSDNDSSLSNPLQPLRIHGNKHAAVSSALLEGGEAQSGLTQQLPALPQGQSKPTDTSTASCNAIESVTVNDGCQQSSDDPIPARRGSEASLASETALDNAPVVSGDAATPQPLEQASDCVQSGAAGDAFGVCTSGTSDKAVLSSLATVALSLPIPAIPRGRSPSPPSGSEGVSSGEDVDPGEASNFTRRRTSGRSARNSIKVSPNSSRSSSQDSRDVVAVPSIGQAGAQVFVKGAGKGKGLSLLAMMPPPNVSSTDPAEPKPETDEKKPAPSPSSPKKEVKKESPESPSRKESIEKGKGKGPPLPKGKGKSAMPPPPLPKGKGKAAPPPPPPAKGKAKGKNAPPAPPKGKSKGEKAKGDKKNDESDPGKAPHKMAKLKPLGWQKISKAEEGTLWAEYDDDGIEISRSMIETLFVWGSSEPKVKVARADGNEEQKVCLTTSSRAMGICIGLHPLRHYSVHRVRQAIMALENTVLTQEATEGLISCDSKTNVPTMLPTPEEVASVKAYLESKQPFDALDDASKFLVAVHDLPSLHDRLLLHHFRYRLDDRVANIQEHLNTMMTALQQVRASKRFASILVLVLKTGNTLNDGTARGGACGFRMSALGQLVQMKQVEVDPAALPDADGSESGTVPHQLRRRGSAGSLTLIDHLVDLIAKQRPELLDVNEDLDMVGRATRVELDDVGRDIKQLRTELCKISNTAAAAASARAPDGDPDPFLEVAPNFVAAADGQMQELDTKLSQTLATYEEVSVFFGEKRGAKPNERLQPHDWLSFIDRFLRDFQRSVALLRAEEARAQRLQRAGTRRLRGRRSAAQPSPDVTQRVPESETPTTVQPSPRRNSRRPQRLEAAFTAPALLQEPTAAGSPKGGDGPSKLLLPPQATQPQQAQQTQQAQQAQPQQAAAAAAAPAASAAPAGPPSPSSRGQAARGSGDAAKRTRSEPGTPTAAPAATPASPGGSGGGSESTSRGRRRRDEEDDAPASPPGSPSSALSSAAAPAAAASLSPGGAARRAASA
eukprot:TRINITY_DN7690_c0_g2_i1.p1 TRINITY_DN7690_c0_g2~~TRINITY_DN7690_c0_g2_i1.p1  ORF type:complete len:1617 (+),score=301.21 TRINITY_DN7690_c0_g2_i1:619-4851(+)